MLFYITLEFLLGIINFLMAHPEQSFSLSRNNVVRIMRTQEFVGAIFLKVHVCKTGIK